MDVTRDEIRGVVISTMADNPRIQPLREFQEMVLEQLPALNGDWKPVSAVCRLLVKDEVLKNIKKGRKFYVEPGPRWGVGSRQVLDAMNGHQRLRQDLMRCLEEDGGARLTSDAATPEVLEYLATLAKAGRVEICFTVPEARVVAYQVEKGEPTMRLQYWDGLTYRSGKGHREVI